MSPVTSLSITTPVVNDTHRSARPLTPDQFPLLPSWIHQLPAKPGPAIVLGRLEPPEHLLHLSQLQEPIGLQKAEKQPTKPP